MAGLGLVIGQGRVELCRRDRLRKCMVGYRYDILWAVCSKIRQEVFIRYDRL